MYYLHHFAFSFGYQRCFGSSVAFFEGFLQLHPIPHPPAPSPDLVKLLICCAGLVDVRIESLQVCLTPVYHVLTVI